MTRHIRSELIKLGSIRTVYALMIAAIGAGLAGGSVLTHPVSEGVWVDTQRHPFLVMFLMLAAIIAYVLGARSVTDEYAHATLASTMLASPRRWRPIAAKALTEGAFGALAGAAATVTAVAVVLRWSAENPAKMSVGASDVLPLVGGIAVTTALYAVIAVGVASIVRQQVATLVGGVAWILIGEGATAPLLGRAARYLPGEAGAAIVGAPVQGLLPRWQGLLYLAAYATVAILAGIAVMRGRDIV